MARSVISSGWIAAEKLPDMPVLVPSIEAQKNTLKIQVRLMERYILLSPTATRLMFSRPTYLLKNLLLAGANKQKSSGLNG